jgi:hypothetical protein
MQALHAEGPATHGDPESCVDVREGGGEALTGAHVGRAIEPRKSGIGSGCRRCWNGGRQHHEQRDRKLLMGPARSKNQGMRGISLRENREVSCPPVIAIKVTGRSGKAKAAILR